MRRNRKKWRAQNKRAQSFFEITAVPDRGEYV